MAKRHGGESGWYLFFAIIILYWLIVLTPIIIWQVNQ